MIEDIVDLMNNFGIQVTQLDVDRDSTAFNDYDMDTSYDTIVGKRHVNYTTAYEPLKMEMSISPAFGKNWNTINDDLNIYKKITESKNKAVQKHYKELIMLLALSHK